MRYPRNEVNFIRLRCFEVTLKNIWRNCPSLAAIGPVLFNSYQCARQAVRASFAQPDRGLWYHLHPHEKRLAVLYLAAVLDLHSRKIVGWAMSKVMPAALVCAALQMAIVQRNSAPGLVVHTDRGRKYASAEHQALLAKHGLVGSMSRNGNCWDAQSKSI